MKIIRLDFFLQNITYGFSESETQHYRRQETHMYENRHVSKKFTFNIKIIIIHNMSLINSSLASLSVKFSFPVWNKQWIVKYLVISPVWTANFDHKVLHVEKYICWILGNIFSVDLIMRFPYKLYNIWQGIKTIHNNLIRSINIYFKIYLTTQSKIASG